MSLIYCPECGHEISNSAVACPNCGRPINARPVVERKVVVADVPRSDDGFPKWAFIPIAVLGAVLLLMFFVYMRNNDDSANSNLAVNVSTRRPTTASQTVSIPPASDTQVETVPQSITVPGSSTTVSGIDPARVEKGTVVIDAKVSTQNGRPLAAKNERFYLLDKDLETILSDAGIEPVEGQSLTNSLGLSILYPGKYGDFHRDALQAIKGHIKYAGQTDGSGKAQLGGVEPDSYYVFGITKTGRGFAVWSSPVSVVAGQNILNLSPQPVTELSDYSGE
ncbi:MAG TPA: zinc-ribbon domain-containing protein [Pyrinomonadaceae bacterium]|nr:zinc-ribbon domain-containing protein [Pyrinomonadaceae bacterium]